jgi:tetratricopeptide (TPR) repeat protein
MVRIVGPGGTQSGFVVSPQGGSAIVVTLLAAVGSADQVSAVDVTGRTHTAQVFYRNRETGIAGAAIKDWTGPRVVDLDPRPLQAGEPIVVVGFDVSTGDLTYLLIRSAGGRQLDRPVAPGFAGGPVISVRDQRVLGMVASAQTVIPAAAVHLVIAASMAPTATPRAAVPASPPPAAQSTPHGLGGQEILIGAYPAGVTIVVDGKSAGQAPLRIPAIRYGPGSHKITGSAPGRLTVARIVSLPVQDSLDVFLPPAPSAVPASPRGRDLLAKLQTALEEANGAQALAHAQELLTESPVIPEIRIYQAVALWQQRNWTEALAAVRGHIDVYGETTRSVDAYVLLGILHEERQRFQDALTGYKLAAKVQPEYAREFQQPVVATETAVQTLARQVAKNPLDLPARIRLGLMYEAKGRFKEGMSEFKAVLYAAPTAPSPAAAATLQQVLTIRTFPSQASVYVGERLLGPSPAVLSGPPPEELQVRVSMLGYADMRRIIRPRGRSDILIVLLPTLEGYGRTRFAIDHMREGLRGYASGDWATATQHLVEAFDSDYTLIKLRIYIGTGYYTQGRLSESIEILKAYINAKDNDSTALLAYALLGVIHEEQSRSQEALTLYKLALKLHPAMSAVIGLPPATTDPEITALQESARRAPDDPRVHYRLGVVMEQKGRFLEGMLAFRRALFSLSTM